MKFLNLRILWHKHNCRAADDIKAVIESSVDCGTSLLMEMSRSYAQAHAEFEKHRLWLQTNDPAYPEKDPHE